MVVSWSGVSWIRWVVGALTLVAVVLLGIEATLLLVAAAFLY